MLELNHGPNKNSLNLVIKKETVDYGNHTAKFLNQVHN